MAVADALVGADHFKVGNLRLEGKAGADGPEGGRSVRREVAVGEDARPGHVVEGGGVMGDAAGIGEVIEELFGVEGGMLGQAVEKIDLGKRGWIRRVVRGREVRVDTPDVE